MSDANQLPRTTEHNDGRPTLRVGGDLAAPTPHRPERARFAHSVLHGPASLASAVAMDDSGCRKRIAIYQPQEALPSDIALPRSPRQPFAPDPLGPVDHGSQTLIVAGNAEVGKVPLQHPAETALLVSDRPARCATLSSKDGMPSARLPPSALSM